MNGWAQRKAAQKRDNAEAGRSLRNLVNEQFAVEGYKTKCVKDTERPATAARRERKAFYGKFKPEWGVCPDCFMILSASGACTGCGETPWYVEAHNETTVCDMTMPEPERTLAEVLGL